MELKEISISNFKKIRSAKLTLGQINYLVGGNNSGKSSILQAIHCAVTAAQSQVVNYGAKVLAEESLIYAPSNDFSLLGYNRPFENRTGGHRAKVTFRGKADDGTDASYSVQLYKGRNVKNVGIERSGRNLGFGAHIHSNLAPFSVFVPGLAGVAHFEEYKTEAYVFRRIAGGEANLYLRNVMLILEERGQLQHVIELAREIFPGLNLRVQFDPKRDLHIDARVRVYRGSAEVPIDLVGTGVLQALQIFAYATLANPTLLLLDEPDSHLHPSNQTLLSKVLEIIVEMMQTKIILATHSRHLINSAPVDAKFFWVDNGTIKPNDDFELIKLLMEIGALDEADAIIGADSPLIIATEDKDSFCLQYLLITATDREYSIINLNGVSNSEIGHRIFEQLIPHIPGTPRLIFHRDRDFMTDDEVTRWKAQFETDQIKCFVTKGSDIESYFLDPAHIAAITGFEEEAVSEFLSQLRRRYKREIRDQFSKKRRDINLKLNRDGGGPHTEDLLPRNDIPSAEHVVGKFLLRKVRAHSQEHFEQMIDPVCEPRANLVPELSELIDQLFAEH